MTNAVDDYQDFLEDGNHRWRKRLILGVPILALIAIGVFVLFTMVLCRGSSTKTTVQTAKVTLGTITKTVSTSATAAAQSSASLSFGASGNITTVNVTVGQAVKQNDVLATIDATTLQDAVTRAQVGLNSAQTALNNLLNPPTAAADEASADQSVIQAQQNLDKANQALQALYDPTSDQISTAQQAVLSAQSGLIKAQQARTAVDTNWQNSHDAAETALQKAKDAEEAASEALDTCNNSTATPRPSCTSQENAYNEAVDAVDTARDALDALGSGPSADDITVANNGIQSAQLALDSANAKLAALTNPSADDVTQAQESVQSAQEALTVAESKRDQTYAGSTASQISAAQDQVHLAQISLTEAEDNLKQGELIAPFDGTVAAVNIAVGETGAGTSTSSTAAIVLNTPNSLVLNISVGETDLPNVKAGQSGTATFDAITGTIFPIVIDSVGTNATTTQGVVTYQAKAHIVSGQSLRATLGGGAAGPSASQTPSASRPEGAGPSASQTPAASQPQAGATPGATATASPQPQPGMNATVTIIVDEAQNVLIVPTSAIQTSGRTSIVTIQNDDGSTTRQTVTTGLTNGAQTEITAGLTEGQTVIIPGATASSTTGTSATPSRTTGGGSFFGGGAGGGIPGGGGAPGGD